jgi:hypothetical protein
MQWDPVAGGAPSRILQPAAAAAIQLSLGDGQLKDGSYCRWQQLRPAVLPSSSGQVRSDRLLGLDGDGLHDALQTRIYGTKIHASSMQEHLRMV